MKKHHGHWTAEDNAYGKGKTDCEVMLYEWGARHGVECMSSCPSVVLGPLLAPPHDMTWQHRLGEMYAGKYHLDILWNVTDVRDIAETQRLMAESSVATNGSRYLNCAPCVSSLRAISLHTPVTIMHSATAGQSYRVHLPKSTRNDVPR